MKSICKHIVLPLAGLILVCFSTLSAGSVTLKVESIVLPQPDNTLQARLVWTVSKENPHPGRSGEI